MVVLPVLVTAKPSQRIVKIVNRPVLLELAMPPSTQYRNVVRANDLGRFAPLGVWTTTRIAHGQQGQGHDRQQRNRRLKPLLGRELRTFDLAARFAPFVIFLSVPFIIPPKITL
jgi:hypothetical protein